MAKERLKSPRARLFVALDLPEGVRRSLVRWQQRAMGDPALRAIAADALHVTLCFLSWRPQREIERIASEVTAVAPRPVELRLASQAVGLPPHRPRLFAVDAPSPAAEELQAELSARLQARGFYAPEKRPFWSHVTVARVKAERRPRGAPGRRTRSRPRRVEDPPGPLPAALAKPFGAVRVALYRSNLRPQGAEYVPLAGLELPPTAR